MAFGLYNSSIIRVQPVFAHIGRLGEENGWSVFLNWISQQFPTKFSHEMATFSTLRAYYSGDGGGELAIPPNPDLLEYLITDEGIEHLRKDTVAKLQSKRDLGQELSETDKARLALFDSGSREEQRFRARIGGQMLRPFQFEGLDYPDVVIVTDKIVLIVEGKLTEPHLTTQTTWLDGRDQMIRHLDSAMACEELSAQKHVLGMYIIGDSSDESIQKSGRHPCYDFSNYSFLGHEEYWKKALPHYARDDDKLKKIACRYLGHVTWQSLGRQFAGIKVPIDSSSQSAKFLLE